MVERYPHYEVYYNSRGPDGIVRQRIGLVDQYGEDAEKLLAKGILVVEDYILPYAQHCKMTEVTPIKEVIPLDAKPTNYMPLDCVITDAWQDYWQGLADEAHKKLTKVGVGAMFYVPVGDGHATYVVTAMRKKGTECKVEWRGFSGDRWVCQQYGMGDWFRTKDVERMCCFRKEPLFASRELPWKKTWAELEKLNWVPPDMIPTLIEAQ